MPARRCTIGAGRPQAAGLRRGSRRGRDPRSLERPDPSMQITVHRGPVLWRERRMLPASTYNLARTLQLRSPGGVAFVPVRSLQVLAIIDHEEFVFVDSQQRAWALLAWQGLRAATRTALYQAVDFDALGYAPLARAAMQRLPREFHEALSTLAERQRASCPARLLPFAPRARRSG